MHAVQLIYVGLGQAKFGAVIKGEVTRNKAVNGAPPYSWV